MNKVLKAARKFVYYMMDLTPPGEEVEIYSNRSGKLMATGEISRLKSREDGVLFIDVKSLQATFELSPGSHRFAFDGHHSRSYTLKMGGRHYNEYRILRQDVVNEHTGEISFVQGYVKLQ
jgi:hypothetical protein